MHLVFYLQSIFIVHCEILTNRYQSYIAEFREFSATRCFRGVGFLKAGTTAEIYIYLQRVNQILACQVSRSFTHSAIQPPVSRQTILQLLVSLPSHYLSRVSSSSSCVREYCSTPVIIPFSLKTFIALFTSSLFLQRAHVAPLIQKMAALCASRAKRAILLCSPSPAAY